MLINTAWQSAPRRLRTTTGSCSKGAAIKLNHVATLPLKLGALLEDKERLKKMKQNARALGRPEAAFVIARFALGWAEAGGSGQGQISSSNRPAA